MKRVLRGRIATALGVLMFVAGVAMVAAGVYAFMDDAGSGRAHRAGRLDPGRDSGFIIKVHPTETAAPEPTEPPLAANVPYRMIIESIGVDAPVTTYSLDEQGIPQVPTGSDAADVVAWYDFSAVPGSGSNAVYSGHVTWFGAAVFYSLSQVQIGDTVKISAEDGTELVYTVSDSFMVDPADKRSLQVMQPTDEDMLTLITCGGTWIPDPNDHVAGGDYTNRQVVRAKLQSVVSAADGQTAGGG